MHLKCEDKIEPMCEKTKLVGRTLIGTPKRRRKKFDKNKESLVIFNPIGNSFKMYFCDKKTYWFENNSGIGFNIKLYYFMKLVLLEN